MMRILFLTTVFGLTIYLLWPWISLFIDNIKYKYRELTKVDSEDNDNEIR